MNITTLIIGGALSLLLAYFLFRLSYIILVNLINGRKFHHALEQEFDSLRLSRMLKALDINKSAYIYRTRVSNINQQMESCSACSHTDECDEKLLNADIAIDEIDFCNNEAELKEIKQQQES